MDAEFANDQSLLDEIIAAMREVRARAPQDFLVLLGLILGVILAVLVLLAILMQDASWKDTLLNISSEIFGSWLTVVLIDGLWRRIQVHSLAEYEMVAKELEKRKTTRLTDEERQAWTLFLQLYRDLKAEEQSGNILRYLRAVYFAWYRRRQLETQGNQVLNDFTKQIKAKMKNEQQMLPMAVSEREELIALRHEVVKLQSLMAGVNRKNGSPELDEVK